MITLPDAKKMRRDISTYRIHLFSSIFYSRLKPLIKDINHSAHLSSTYPRVRKWFF